MKVCKNRNRQTKLDRRNEAQKTVNSKIEIEISTSMIKWYFGTKDRDRNQVDANRTDETPKCDAKTSQYGPDDAHATIKRFEPFINLLTQLIPILKQLIRVWQPKIFRPQFNETGKLKNKYRFVYNYAFNFDKWYHRYIIDRSNSVITTP